MHIHRLRNKILQRLYRPASARPRYFSSQTLTSLDAIEQAIEQKITPLLAGLLSEHSD